MSQSEKLAEMLLNEMLIDICIELTNIENEMKETHLRREQVDMMTDLLLNVEEVEVKENEIKAKYQHQKREIVRKGNANIFSIFEDPLPNPISVVKYTCPFIDDDELKPKMFTKIIAGNIQVSIICNRERMEEYLKATNSSTSAELFKIYDFIAEDLTKELVNSALQDASHDLDEIVDKMILGEFGVRSSISSK